MMKLLGLFGDVKLLGLFGDDDDDDDDDDTNVQNQSGCC